MKIRFILVLAGLVGLGAAGQLAAAAEKFELHKTTINLPEFPPTEAYTLQTDDHGLTFIPPHEARVLSDGTRREVRLSFRDDRCLITLKHGDVSPTFVLPGGWEQLRGVVRGRYPKAEVSEGSVCLNSCGARGCSFTISEKTGYRNLKLITQLSFIPVEGGTLEISMTANDNKFAAQQTAYHNFLNCLRLEKQDEPKTGLAKN